MIRISGIKIDAHKEQMKILKQEIASTLHVKVEDIIKVSIFKQSIDARKKDRVYFIYTVDASVKGKEEKLVQKCKRDTVSMAVHETYQYPSVGQENMPFRPIVIGAGPAGLHAALLLAEMGYCPILLERGKDVDQRTMDVDQFWKTGQLNIESNVQFGEGGAGTFSDGKLTTVIKDIRCKKVLEILVANGAPDDILYVAKPHIGTDILKNVVKNIRQQIVSLGGEVRFEAKVTALVVDENKAISGVEINNDEILNSNHVILSIGHSARDTFEQLLAQGVEIQQKAFAIGLRIEHNQFTINKAQYGKYATLSSLGAADYKLSHRASNGRNVYTFCMCPGGQVVAAASEEGGIVVNGMSYHDRKGRSANSAIVVGVGPDDFSSSDPLAGVAFQRKWEKLAYKLGGADFHAPVQLVGDFLNNKPSSDFGKVIPTYEPDTVFSDLTQCLPAYVTEAIQEGIAAFGKKLDGFDHKEAILTGVETRTSSPIRIVRKENFQSTTITGLYPCGEGAGYAGGIISAAVDGLRVAEIIINTYEPKHKNQL